MRTLLEILVAILLNVRRAAAIANQQALEFAAKKKYQKLFAHF
jgi:hypothetical protein